MFLGKTSTNPKCHLTISWATSCQYQCVCKISSQYSTQFKRQGHFHFFRIWSSAKPRPMKNIISQSLGLDLVNINVYAKVYQSIPLISRGRAIFTFFRIWRSAKPRATINVISQSLGLDVVNINAYAKCYQNIPNGLELSTFFTNSPVTKSSKLSGDKIKCLIIGHSMKVNLQFQLTFLGSCNSIGCQDALWQSSMIVISYYYFSPSQAQRIVTRLEIAFSCLMKNHRLLQTSP